MDHTRHRQIHAATGVFGGTVLFFATSLTLFHLFVWFIVHLWVATIPDLDHHIPVLDHRGWSHTFFAAISASVVGWIATRAVHRQVEVTTELTVIDSEIWAIVIAVGIGVSYAQHITEDMLTAGGGFGVEPLWPISGWSPSLTGLSYDSVWFSVLSLVLVVLSVVGSLLFMDWWGIVEVVDPVLDLLGV